jgi:hypothetical protein
LGSLAVKNILSIGAVVAAVLLAPGIANAGLEQLDFSTMYNGGPFNGDTLSGNMLLDVVGGVATSGTLTISGAGLPGTQTMRRASDPSGSCRMNSLAIQVQEGLGRDPHAGDLYVY